MSQQRIPKLIWVATIFIAAIVGIFPGVVVAQSHYVWAIALIGWFAFPLGLYEFLTGQSFGDPQQWLLTLVYPLAMLGYSVCAGLIIYSKQLMRKGLLLVLVAAFISALASIPAAMVAQSIVQETSLSSFMSYLPALPMHGIIFFHLLISALLGWLIGGTAVRLFRRQAASAA